MTAAIVTAIFSVALMWSVWLWARVQMLRAESKRDSITGLKAQIQELREMQEAQVASINSAVDAAMAAHKAAEEAALRVGRLELSKAMSSPPSLG